MLVQALQEALYILNGSGFDISFVLQLLQIQLVEGVVGNVVLFGTPRKKGMEILVWMIVPGRTGGWNHGEVSRNFPFENIDTHGIGGLLHKRINVPLIIM